MPDLAIGAAISGLKTAGEMVGSFVKLRDEAMIQAKVIELQAVILSAQGNALAAQGEQFALLDEKRSLEKDIAELKAWEREKERYTLEHIGQDNALCYGLKPESKGAEADHKLCASCFDRGHRSLLQPHTIPVGHAKVLMCHACNSQILLHGVADTRTVNSRPAGTASFASITRG